jgi:hypothetical protein
MNNDSMKKEIERIFGAALNARREAARLGMNGMATPKSAYSCGKRDALEFVLEELAQTFGLKIEEEKV